VPLRLCWLGVEARRAARDHDGDVGVLTDRRDGRGRIERPD
jgi:hypothetical protein